MLEGGWWSRFNLLLLGVSNPSLLENRILARLKAQFIQRRNLSTQAELKRWTLDSVKSLVAGPIAFPVSYPRNKQHRRHFSLTLQYMISAAKVPAKKSQFRYLLAVVPHSHELMSLWLDFFRMKTGRMMIIVMAPRS